MDAHVQNNTDLRNVHRALVAGDEQFTRDAVATAAATPHNVPWLKRILKDMGKDIEPILVKILQDAIAEWETPTSMSGVLGGEATSEPPPPRRPRSEPPQSAP